MLLWHPLTYLFHEEQEKIFATNDPIGMKMSAMERRNKGEFFIWIYKKRTTSGSSSICAYKNAPKVSYL